MSEFQDLLVGICPEIETRAHPWLIFIKAYLPQVWVLKTESEIVTLTVSKDGKATVMPDESKEPDVIVEWTSHLLATAIRTRDKKQIPPGEKPRVKVATWKGNAAVGFLKQTFGLGKIDKERI